MRGWINADRYKQNLKKEERKKEITAGTVGGKFAGGSGAESK
jgi:hypothetical protein